MVNFEDAGMPVAYHKPNVTQIGFVRSWNKDYVFVQYIRNGHLQQTAQATRREDLHLIPNFVNDVSQIEEREDQNIVRSLVHEQA